jgi:predicted metal-dependent hydrolase
MQESILISLIFIFMYFLICFNNNTQYIETNIGTKFFIRSDDKTNDKTLLLSKIIENMFKLKNYLYININNYSEFTQYIKQLNNNLDENKTIIYETEPNSDLTSYSVNKGEEISFCLRSKKNDSIHELNLLTYVALHEMAHIACPEIGHGPLFKKIFKFLTEIAIEIGIYNKQDYNNEPIEYCGMILSSSIV